MCSACNKATFVILLGQRPGYRHKTYIGDPIDCIHVEENPQGVMDTYCWIHSTFSVTNKDGGSPEAHPGVKDVHQNDEVRFHKYYQWVCSSFKLFGSTPRYHWKNWEAGK